ncbi:UDP-N-acetylmuramoyl-L-alanine--D-glutamate ligase [Helicobacter brantae]|uniref:UDP-N-acetylmuramoylalanine--D-glutamate ligase n=1 Tax=Helicobacter brantae TaxID=375927 RepID=A0A3D8IZ31_9HELI|nr:UDP-N-acetylmuramoyl-L-alanine--D-glutamate ligase [Helicobacter brantae]RDU70246.1 UDP-N-acetylmuramoyl-L-alanine--D-glutamate ligase [Helicobacter brantae]
MIALLGFGKTNQALLNYLNAQGKLCVVCDDSFTQERIDERGNIFTPILTSHPTSLQIPSPGVPPYHKMIKESTNLVSEYDYILPHIQDKQIWISGTNGKTTTTEMLEWVLRDFGGESGGNIGTPLAVLAERKPKIWILETSSFSLHYTKISSPHCYLLLPLSEDHISWHGSFGEYVNDKLSVLERMGEGSVAFIPKSLENHPKASGFRGELVAYRDCEDLASWLGIETFAPGFKEPFLLDALLALCGAKVICGENRVEAMRGYKIGEHKMEEIVDSKGRLWINDSKGTNADASIWALRNYEGRKIYLILGGEDKGADLSELFEEMRGKEIEIFAIGKNAQRLQELSKEYHFSCKICETLENAVKSIHPLHTQESVAILSPAAASLDQFSSYKHRGEEFKRLVSSLL